MLPLRRDGVFSVPGRAPDLVIAQTLTATSTGEQSLRREGSERWTSEGVVVTTALKDGALHVMLASPACSIKRLYLRWRGRDESKAR